MNKEIIISERFCGPPDSGNGGYVSGLMASELEGAVEVTLRKPIPLLTKMNLDPTDEGVDLREGNTLIAEARRVESLDMLTHKAPVRADVVEAMLEPIVCGDEGVSFGHCFVCGSDRAEGDGLRIICGRLADGRSAALWQPDPTLDDGNGCVDPVYLWSALDCPGYASIHEAGRLALLGRFTAEIIARPSVSEPMIVCGEKTRQDGRKFYTNTTLYTTTGQVVGFAKAIWISVDSV